MKLNSVGCLTTAFLATFGAVLAAPELAAGQGATLPPNVEIRVPKPPTIAPLDGRRVLIYEIHVTSFLRDTLALRRIDVLGAGGASLGALADSAIPAAVARPGLQLPAAARPKIGSGLRAVVYMWIPLADGTPAPRSIRHRVTFQQLRSDTSKTIPDTGKTVIAESGEVGVTGDAVAIGPPLRGGSWLAANGPAAGSGHRRAMIAIDGGQFIAQRFAIDYVKSNGTGRRFTGDSLKNESYAAYGMDALAVADGQVVAVKDGIPQNVPGITSRAVPITLETVGGNHVIIDIGGGHFAFYAHLQPGSIRVKMGDRVKRGQVVGLVGNSGNSTEPHLHFHISDGNSPLGSEGLPYVHDSFEVVGRCGSLAAACTAETPTVRRNEMPVANELIRFP